jgi:hypothetical protein
MLVIALSGWAKSGKDTAGAHLVANHGFTRVAFADVLKDLVASQYQIPRSWLDDQQYKETPIIKYPVLTKDGFSEHLHGFMSKEFREHNGKLHHTPRSLAILEGSVKRSVDPNYWVNTVVSKINKLNEFNPTVHGSGVDRFVITDMRYRSELELLQVAFSTDLFPVRINRWASNPSTDPSETDLDSINFPLVLQNVSTVEEYFNKIDLLTKDLGIVPNVKNNS